MAMVISSCTDMITDVLCWLEGIVAVMVKLPLVGILQLLISQTVKLASPVAGVGLITFPPAESVMVKETPGIALVVLARRFIKSPTEKLCPDVGLSIEIGCV